MPFWFDHLKTAQGHPAAEWIWAASDHPGRWETALFRVTLEPPPSATHMELQLSAEGRYTLWLNDNAEALGRGPARTDMAHRSLDTYALELDRDTPLQLWAQVSWAPAGAREIPLAETHGPVPGFLAFVHFLNARGEILETHGTGTNAAWQACMCTGLTGEAPKNLPGFVCIGNQEIQNSLGWAGDWRKAPFLNRTPDARWQKPQIVGDLCFREDPETVWGTASGQGWLSPRDIPHMQERPVIFQTILQTTAARSTTLDTLASIAVDPGERVLLRLDAGEAVNAYIRLSLKGAGTKVEVASAEVLRDATGQKIFLLENAQRISPAITDRFVLDASGDAFTFETRHWRAFRFLDVEILGGAAGGELVSLHATATAYPFEKEFEFIASSTEGEAVAETIQKITDISWRTLRNCAWETFMDCPYYEQLQYVGDTRIQCLLTYVTTQDIALPVQALRAFDRSRTPEGLTQSRFPCASAGMQIIPTFSLIYILMIEDYLIHTGDDALVAELRPGIAPILNWFTQFIDPDTHLLGAFPYWPFMDWVNGWDKGIPPHNTDLETHHTAQTAGASAVINLFYLLAQQSACNIYERTKPGSGNFYATRATAFKQRLHDAFYDAGRGLICDVPVDEGRGRTGVWSQHAQALATLTGVLSITEGREAMTVALNPKNVLHSDESLLSGSNESREGRYIAPASLYFRFYLAEAIAQLRMGDQFWPLLKPFRDAIARGSTTWPEAFEPSRSECHAWSSWPLYFLARHVLGISPPSPEDGRTRVRPLHCPPLGVAAGQFRTHRGAVTVQTDWTQVPPTVEASGVAVEVVRH